MDHLKEYNNFDDEDNNIFEKFSDIVKKLIPGLKKDGETEAAEDLEKLDTPENAEKVKKNIFNRTADFAKDTWDAVKRESKETKQAMQILQRMVKGENVSDNEKKFLKQQSGDLIKGVAAVAISGLPVPFPITPLLIIVGKKYNFNVLPQDQQHLLDEIGEIVNRNNEPTEELHAKVKKTHEGVEFEYEESYYLDYEVDENSGKITENMAKHYTKSQVNRNYKALKTSHKEAKKLQ